MINCGFSTSPAGYLRRKSGNVTTFTDQHWSHFLPRSFPRVMPDFSWFLQNLFQGILQTVLQLQKLNFQGSPDKGPFYSSSLYPSPSVIQIQNRQSKLPGPSPDLNEPLGARRWGSSLLIPLLRFLEERLRLQGRSAGRGCSGLTPGCRQLAG